ncbi:MAG: LysE family translocator [Blastomonas sp.]
MNDQLWLAFAATVLAIELTPGPNMAWLAALTIGEGKRAGLAAMAGIALGLAIVALAAALGLAALVQTEILVWQILRWAGIAYLLWLSWEGWRDAGKTFVVSAGSEAGSEQAQWLRRFRDGLVINLLNPKAGLFYIVILPNFLPPGDHGLLQTALLSLINIAVATFVHLMIVLLATRARPWLMQSSRTRTVRRALALALVAVAIWFAFTT